MSNELKRFEQVLGSVLLEHAETGKGNPLIASPYRARMEELGKSLLNNNTDELNLSPSSLSR